MVAGVKGGDTGGGRIKIYSKGSNVVLRKKHSPSTGSSQMYRGECQRRAVKGDLVKEYDPKCRAVSCSGSVPGKAENLLEG